ncbi:MAG: hypothetical protein ABSB35_03080 [Bryobacteraceae bacterium]|jgi:DUF4097 and DUF4098 domain-containing protein YvlB
MVKASRLPQLAAALLVSALLVATAMAQSTRLEQDGLYWVRTVNTPVAVPQTARLRIATRGHVVLRGATGDQVTYILTQRVRARSEAEALRLLGSWEALAQRRPDGITLVVLPKATGNVISELQVFIPRSVNLAILDTQTGDIEAYDLEGSLQASTPAGMIRCDRIHGAVWGRTGDGEIHLGKVNGQVRCLSGGGSIMVDSAGADANCQTAGGEIIVRQAGGPLVLSTEGGNIQVEKAASTVQAHTGEGVIDVYQAGGTVVADTRGGSIQVGSARGVKCESAAGTIRVKTSASPLRISTAVGSILAELLAGTKLDDSSLVAGSGDVTVMIPANLALSVLAQNDAGGRPRIVSDFAGIRSNTFGVTQPATVEGAINGGGPVLHINVDSGTIYLRRLK